MNIQDLFHFTINYHHIILTLLHIVLIILGAMFIYYIVGFIIKRFFSLSLKTIRMKHKELLRRRQKTLEKITLSLWRYFVYFVTLLIILSEVGINIQTILAGAGILGVVVAVGSQNLMKDFLEGFFNVFEDNISVGDYVSIDDVEGNIIDIGLRTIKVKSYSGEVHIVPNSKIGHIINYSLENGKAIVDILVDYQSDLEKVLEVIKRTMHKVKEDNPNVLAMPTILGVNKLDSIGYEIRIICDTLKETHWGVQRMIRSELMMSFKTEQLHIGINQIKIISDNQRKNK